MRRIPKSGLWNARVGFPAREKLCTEVAVRGSQPRKKQYYTPRTTNTTKPHTHGTRAPRGPLSSVHPPPAPSSLQSLGPCLSPVPGDAGRHLPARHRTRGHIYHHATPTPHAALVPEVSSGSPCACCCSCEGARGNGRGEGKECVPWGAMGVSRPPQRLAARSRDALGAGVPRAAGQWEPRTASMAARSQVRAARAGGV